ncbi:glycosyltransferase [Paraliobacillus zengyii]|uniref:glycosyltransferase n=1 Tax=Paraliobacillus zengyii TaxID=2213194 RepID=UPI0013A68990|nr:glycosyltransferase [Paraliobacillus zengyii]
MKEFKVAIIGQIARWKGQDVFIKAAKLLHLENPKVKFLIIGDVLFDKKGEHAYKKEIIELAKDCDYITFLGHRDDVSEMIKEIDIIVHASIREEPFGRVIIEGMAAKKPVIASAIGGPLEIIEGGVSGIFYEPGDYNELAKKIDIIIMDEQLYKDVAINGYLKFQHSFHVRNTVNLVERSLTNYKKKKIR